MQALVELKRKSEACVSYKLCIVFQQSKHDKLYDATDQGLSTFKEKAAERHKVGDPNYHDAIDGITSSSFHKFIWHKLCYSDFTHKGKIKRLHHSEIAVDHGPSTSRCTTNVPITSPSSPRSSVKAMKWDDCMFCQVSDTKQTLCAVTTFRIS